MAGVISEYLELAHTVDQDEFVGRHPHPVLLRRRDSATTDPRSEYRSTLKMKVDMESRQVRVEPLPPSPLDQVLVLCKSESNSFANKVLLGRTETNDVVIPHLAVSKHHAFFRRDQDARRYTITDTGSTNGTKLNGQIIPPREPRYIGDGDQVSFGDAAFTFYSPEGLYDLLRSLSALR